jgi:hypothetical protein
VLPARSAPAVIRYGVFLVLPLALSLAGCSRRSDEIRLTAPFNEETEVGEVTAVWRASGEERTFAGGARLKEPQVELRYRVDVRNRLEDPLFVRLGSFELLDEDGLALGDDRKSVECASRPGLNAATLSGSVWVAKRDAQRIRAFRVRHFAVPLSERGRALYREYLLERRPGEEAKIDAELNGYAAAPPCSDVAEKTEGP